MSAQLKCVSINNQECKVRPQIFNVNSDELVFYPFSIKASKSLVVTTMSIIRMQNYMVLMLLKISMLKYLI